jgi:glutaredoxin
MKCLLSIVLLFIFRLNIFGEVFDLSGKEYDIDQPAIMSNSPNRIVFLTSSNCNPCVKAKVLIFDMIKNDRYVDFDLYIVNIDPPREWCSEVWKANGQINGVPATIIYEAGIRIRVIMGVKELMEGQ